MAAMQGFLGPLSLDFVIIFFICGEFISFAQTKSSGVHLSFAITTTA